MLTPWAVVGDEDLKVLKELETASDRAVAIVLGSLVEVRVQKFLRRYMIGDEAVETYLFGINGPLGSFATKIRLAYVLGLISQEVFADLKRFQDLRNKFAHKLEISSFNHPDVSQQCQHLKYFMKVLIDSKTDKPLDETVPQATFGCIYRYDLGDLVDPRARYVVSAKCYSIGFNHDWGERKSTPFF